MYLDPVTACNACQLRFTSQSSSADTLAYMIKTMLHWLCNIIHELPTSSTQGCPDESTISNCHRLKQSEPVRPQITKLQIRGFSYSGRRALWLAQQAKEAAPEQRAPQPHHSKAVSRVEIKNSPSIARWRATSTRPSLALQGSLRRTYTRAADVVAGDICRWISAHFGIRPALSPTDSRGELTSALARARTCRGMGTKVPGWK